MRVHCTLTKGHFQQVTLVAESDEDLELADRLRPVMDGEIVSEDTLAEFEQAIFDCMESGGFYIGGRQVVF